MKQILQFYQSCNYNSVLTMNILVCFLMLISGSLAELEFELIRLPKQSNTLPLTKNACQDPNTIGNQTKYQEICLQKDIAYSIQFYSHPSTFRLALDLTTPVSWIKGQTCKIIGTSQRCSLIEENLSQRIKNALKRKVTDLIQKLKMKIVDDQSDQAVIEGSNQIIMGSPQKLINTTITAKNNDHVSHFVDIVMLGLFIIGEKDVITLNETNFIRAHEISPNLDMLSDGAVSLRFDSNSENSFLTELFNYLKTKQKIISIYLGDHAKIATVGSYSTKFIKNGVSSLRRIKIQQDEKHGKLPTIQGIILEGTNIEDNDMEDNSSVVFSLSSSFLGLPNTTIHNFIEKFIGKPNTCTIAPYLQCTFHSTKNLQSFIGSTVNFDFDTSILGFLIRDLILHQEGKKIKFNIKQSLSNYVIIGEPFFLKYYAYFDYEKNEIGFAQRALSIEESFIQLVTLIHLVVLLIIFVLAFVLTSDKFKKFYYDCFIKMTQKLEPTVRRVRQKYRPVRGESIEESKDTRAPALGEDIEGI